MQEEVQQDKPGVEDLRLWKHHPITQYIFNSIDLGTISMMNNTVDYTKSSEEIAHQAIYTAGVIDGLNLTREALESDIELLSRPIVEEQENSPRPFLTNRFERSRVRSNSDASD